MTVTTRTMATIEVYMGITMPVSVDCFSLYLVNTTKKVREKRCGDFHGKFASWRFRKGRQIFKIGRGKERFLKKLLSCSKNLMWKGRLYESFRAVNNG